MRARTILVPLAIVLALPFVLVLLVFGFAQTDPGRRILIDQVAGLAGGPDMQISIGAIEGLVPFDMTFRDVAIADADGRWLAIDRARLAWAPAELAARTLRITTLEADTVTLDRLPAGGGAEEEPSTGPLIPELPVDIRLDDLTVRDLVLGAGVAGVPARLSVEGDARLGDPAEGLTARLAINRLDATPGHAELSLAFTPATEALEVSLSVDEPQGGVIAALAALPGQPPVTLQLVGDGTLSDWQATLFGQAGDLGDVQGSARIRPQGDGRLATFDIGVRAAGLAPAAAAPLLAETTRITGRIGLPAGGTIAVETLKFEAAAGTIELAGGIDPAASTVDMTYSLVAGPVERFAGMVPADTAWSAISLQGSATGSLDAPTITADLSGSDVLFGDYRAQSVTASVLTTSDRPYGDPDASIDFTASGTAAGLSLGNPAYDAILGPATDWQAKGRVTRTGQATLDELRIETGGSVVSLVGQADAGIPDGTGTLRVAIEDLSRFAGLAGQALSGSLDATFDTALDAEGNARVALEGTIDHPAVEGIPAAAALLGERATLSGTVARSLDGAIAFDDVVVTGERAEVAATGRMAGQSIDATVHLALADLAALDPTVAGKAAIDATLSGPLDDLAVEGQVVAESLAVAGHTAERLAIDVDATGLPGAPAGTVRIAGTVDGRPAQGSARLAQRADGGVDVSELSLDLAGITAQGDAAIGPEDPLGGSIRAAVADLGVVGALIGETMHGSADATITLDPASRTVKVDARIRNLVYGSVASVGSATLTAEIADPLTSARRIVASRLVAEGVDAGGQRLSRAEIQASGTLDRVALRLSAAGAFGSGEAAATIALAPQPTQIDLASLRVTTAGQTIALARPTMVRIDPAGTASFDRIELTAAGGTLSLSGHAGGNALNLQVRLAGLPLAAAETVSPGLGLTGRLDGEATITGTPSAPTGRFSLRAAGVRMAQATAVGLPGFDATAEGRIEGSRVALTARVTASTGATLNIRADVPLSPAGRFSADLTGRLELAMFNDFLGAGADRIGGSVAVDLRLEGSLTRPTGSGTVRLTNGLYENAQYGIGLTAIEATLTGTGQALRLTSLSAQTPGGGRLTGSGSIGLQPDSGFPIDVSLQADGATLIDSDLATVTTDADLRLFGPFEGEPRLSGTVTIRHADIHVPDSLPASVIPIPVRRINSPPRIAERVRETEAAAPAGGGGGGSAAAIALDIEVSAPGHIFVRGHGIDAEMEGDIRITGTASRPIITGDFEMRHGSLTQFGQRLDFERGRLVFTGDGKLDPELDFVASTSAGDITAQVLVTGHASHPKITFTSVPPLPQDEVLSRLLFGKATGELSPAQAIQLAEAAAQLAGITSGPGIFEEVRESLGVDRFDLGTGADGESEVTVGRYIGEDVYVGVEQGLSSGDTRATVNIDITPNIKAQAGVGGQSGGSIGLSMEWEY